jgi:hypothetical protein
MADLGAFAVCSRRLAGNLSVGRLPASGGTGGVEQAMCVMCEQCAGNVREQDGVVRLRCIRCREQEWNLSNSVANTAQE